MEENNKQLLIRDICARLPYGVYVKFKQHNEPLCLSVKDVLAIYNGGELINDLQYLYLRPMSSMTEEEKEWLYSNFDYIESFGVKCYDKIPEYYDWLNEHHFDYRGLLEKGLALEAPEGMYKKKSYD